MENALVTALVISAIGMTLLFLSLILFYGIISLLTRVTREKPSPSGKVDGTEAQRDAPADRMQQAAAIAVALARAGTEGTTGRAGVLVPQASGDREVTSWWSLHHQHRLAEKEPRRR